MTGVEILTTIEVATEFDFCWTAFWSIFIGAMVIGTIIAIIHYLSVRDESVFVALVPISFMGLIFGALLGIALSEPTKHETHYEVTISDEVNFNEFVEKYEVIEQDGKIYTVREKENESKN